MANSKANQGCSRLMATANNCIKYKLKQKDKVRKIAVMQWLKAKRRLKTNLSVNVTFM